MGNNNFFITVWMVISLLVTVGNSKNHEEKSKHTTTIVTTSGKNLNIDKTPKGIVFHEYKDKIVILEVYGDTCRYCVSAIPEYNELQNKFHDQIQIITIESYGHLDRKALNQFSKRHDMRFPTVARQDSGKLLKYVQELTGYSSERYGVPAIFILDKNGTLVKSIPPQPFSKEQVENIIQKLIHK